MAETKPDAGWFFGTARKAHYFDGDRRSLCGRWSTPFTPIGAFEPEDKPSSDDCVVCRRRLDKRGVK